jgi:flavin-dependent dehydrogenase
MLDNSEYDCAIIGGGVAGLSLAILLAKDLKKVILFEKESYPYHKVCGEYISNERFIDLRFTKHRFSFFKLSFGHFHQKKTQHWRHRIFAFRTR